MPSSHCWIRGSKVARILVVPRIGAVTAHAVQLRLYGVWNLMVYDTVLNKYLPAVAGDLP
jgi:hypothetical protein